MKLAADTVKNRAAHYGRHVDPMTYAYVVIEGTDTQAEATYKRLVEEIGRRRDGYLCGASHSTTALLRARPATRHNQTYAGAGGRRRLP